MDRPQRINPSRRPLKFKLPSFPEDPKLAYLDSVGATLMLSRFGSGATYVLTPRFEGTPGDDPFSFLDLMQDAAVGWHDTATFLGRTIPGRAFSRSILQKPARSKGIAHPDTTAEQNPTTRFPTTLARGSPNSSGTYHLQPSQTVDYVGFLSLKGTHVIASGETRR